MNNENKVPVLSFQNIGKAFGENWVLSDVSMDIMPGESMRSVEKMVPVSPH